MLVSSRRELGVIAPNVRFRVIRERRVRLAPLLLAVLADEFEREGPGKDWEEGSGMDWVLVPQAVTLWRTIVQSKTHPTFDNPSFREYYLIHYT